MTPKIRFSGYDEPYKVEPLSAFMQRIMRKNTHQETDIPLTISSQDGLVDQRTYFGKKVASADMSGYYLLNRGEFAYNKSTSIGFPFGSIKRLDKYESGAVSTLYICFALKGNKCDSEYIKHYFDAQKWNKEVAMICAEGSRNHGLLNIPVDDFFDTLHYIPESLSEQQKIAAFLSAYDKKISLQKERVETLKEQKRGLLQKMFPKKGETVPELRFPGFTDDWEQRKLEDIVEFLDMMRRPLEGAKRIPGPYPYYGASGIVDYVEDYIFDEELVLLSEDGANITDRNYPVCFLAAGKYWVNNHAHVLKAKLGNENNFICNSLERKDYKQYNTGMAMPKLNQDVCRKIPVSCPSYEEQKKIGNYFRDLDHLITLHQRKCEQLKELKKFMLQNMFPKKG